MKKILVLIGLVMSGIAYGQHTFYVGVGSSTVDPAAVASQIADSNEIIRGLINNLTLGVDVATSADSVLVLDDGKLKVMSKAEFLADIYSALDQIAGGMITNGTFDNSNSWTLGASWSIDSGVATYDGSFAPLSQTDANMGESITPSTSYTLTFDVTSAQEAFFALASSDGGVEYVGEVTYQQGARTIIFTTPSNIGVGGIRFICPAPLAYSIDNVTLLVSE